MNEHAEGSCREAMLYERLSGGRVRCNLCHHQCVISDGKRGVCQVRENRGQTLFTLVYGRAIAQHVDAVEKKPLFHFFPGSSAYSIGTPGCNFRCRWCQNWEISQTPCEQHLIAGQELRPEQIVAAAQRAGSRSIAYTYTEPTIFFEYAYETARRARAAGIANVFVTNGYLSRQALETFQPLLDAANMDLKAFRDETYRNYTGARLQPVLDTMKRMKQLGVWLEVTTLVVPGINDDPQELRDAADFVAQELGVATPWHISRFFPDYQMTAVPPTPVATLRRAEQIGRDAGLQYVYVGNVREDADTYCHACGELLIRRALMAVSENRVQLESRCPRCGATVAGVGMTYRNPST